MGVTFKHLCLFLISALLIQFVASKGTIDVRFIRYQGNGKDAKGTCCEFICANQCDPYFTICLDHIGGTDNVNDCHLKGPLVSEPRHGTNGFTFGDTIDESHVNNGIDNPITKSFSDVVPNDIYLKVMVDDTDPLNGHDRLGFIEKQIRQLEHGKNGVIPNYKTYTVGPDTAELTFGVRSYCDKHYYGNTCLKYCKDSENGGHYTCSSEGDKVCHFGWKGDNCDVDINECVIPDHCKNGATCQNLEGGYDCLCADGFKGVQCEQVNHTCAINPCLHGGSCTGNQTHFRCDCPPWWSGFVCESAVDVCASSPCRNGATCIPNQDTPPGYTCNCKSVWTGQACDVEVTTTTTTSSTTTTTTTTTPTSTTTQTTNTTIKSTSTKTTTSATTVELIIGDPSFITLLGIIDNSNYPELVNGLRALITDLGGVPGDVDVRVTPKYIPIRDGVDTTEVEFTATVDGRPVDKSLIDDILNGHDDETINSYLPLPLYRPSFGPEKRVQENSSWAADNWYVFLLVGLAVIVLLVIILAFLVSRRRKDKQNSFMRSDSNVEQTQPPDMAFENVLYHETHRNRHSDAVDGGTVTFNPAARQQQVQHGAYGENPYAQPVQYDTPVKQPSSAPNGVMHYMNSNLAALDTRCEAGANNYTTFSDLDGAHSSPVVENPYQELDDVQAQKAALAVGFPLDAGTSTGDVESDSEDEIDRIKAQIRREEHDQ